MTSRNLDFQAKAFLNWWDRMQRPDLYDLFSFWSGGKDFLNRDRTEIKDRIERNVWRYDYGVYLKTQYWIRLSSKAKALYGSCVLCPRKDRLNTHHRNYDHLGQEETLRDLVVLCNDCHRKFHGIKRRPA